ncbi:MAG: glycosyltransferase [Sphingomonadaceae bacterium]
MRVVNVAELAQPGWRFMADEIDRPDIAWSFHSATPQNAIERLIRRPRIARYRAALVAAIDARQADVLISHMPIVSAVTASAMRLAGAKARHLAVSFNFTDLPAGRRLNYMRGALQGVDRFLVYSRAEQRLYPELFGLDPARFDFLHWPMEVPPSDGALPPCAGPYICAMGGEARDLATLAAAMRRLPHVPLVIVTRPGAIDANGLPSNVRLVHNLPLGAFWDVVRHARISVVPLRNGETNCGHITLVGSMLLGRAIVATRSAGIADYVEDGETARLCAPRDPDALAAAIDEVWTDASLRERLAERGRAFATEMCDGRRMADYVRRYLEACDGAEAA